MQDIVGYCLIRSTATTFTGTKPLAEFLKHPMRCTEINEEGDVLVINPAADAMASVHACDVLSKFRCDVHGEYLLPPDLDYYNQVAYIAKLMNRKGGYNNTLRQMIVYNSLRKGKYDDDFIFQKEREENAKKQSND